MSARMKSGPWFGMPVFAVEVHELHANDGEAGLLDDVGLNGRIGNVLRLDPRGGFDLGDHPAIAFFRERVDGDENVVFEKRSLENDRGAGVDGAAGRLDGGQRAAVVEVDEHGVRELLARARADPIAHVEDGLKVSVRAKLGRARLVHFPPELPVALQPGRESRLGEAVGASHELTG